MKLDDAMGAHLGGMPKASPETEAREAQLALLALTSEGGTMEVLSRMVADGDGGKNPDAVAAIQESFARLQQMVKAAATEAPTSATIIRRRPVPTHHAVQHRRILVRRVTIRRSPAPRASRRARVNARRSRAPAASDGSGSPSDPPSDLAFFAAGAA